MYKLSYQTKRTISTMFTSLLLSSCVVFIVVLIVAGCIILTPGALEAYREEYITIFESKTDHSDPSINLQYIPEKYRD